MDNVKQHMEFVADVIASLQAMEITTFGRRVAVVRDPTVEKVGSLFIPEAGKRREPRGTIVALGNDVDAEDGVRVGDRVMYTKYAPIHFTVTMPDGREAELELLHVSDLYLGWSASAARVGYVDEGAADGS